MNTVEIFGKDIRCSFPASWEEMNDEQVKHVFRDFCFCVEKGISPLEFNIRTLYYLAKIKRTWKSSFCDKLQPKRVADKNANIIILCEKCLDWILEEKEGAPIISFNLTRNVLPTIKVGLQTLIGPADLLQDLTFGEFRNALNAHKSFLETQNIEDLNECLVFLYRKLSKKPNLSGRYVDDVSNASIAKQLKLVSKIANWQKNLILLWFSNCIRALQSDVITIDGEEIDMSLLFASSESTKAYSSTWNDLLIQIAKENIIGNKEEVNAEPLYSIFQIMWHNFKEYKNNEKIDRTH